MSDQQYLMGKSITALRAAAEGIAAAMEQEAITSEQVQCLLSIIADQMQSINDMTDRP